jgi:hypothetical protein
MHQIKIFKGVESNLTGLEKEVNQWLYQSKARVANMFGNIAPQSIRPNTDPETLGKGYAPSDVLLVVLYDEPI